MSLLTRDTEKKLLKKKINECKGLYNKNKDIHYLSLTG
ncbi:hypothetical protein BbiDN127_C0011 (plasmid) [Borreliella bissettiae DN127]|uniref:Uncharacterized protein n=1 Tax=Borrelia bissettiae (strain DSM 17990 / CIP 109136 / DN127) TaxID=521010 RepID=G0ANX7_BORBD|nr:hypothetical protein BbiDN127_C0011 [Borreliella bissettiae DN127]